MGKITFVAFLGFSKRQHMEKNYNLQKKSLLKKYLNPHFIREGIENKSNFSAARRM